MNILIDKPPITLSVGNDEYSINTDYRAGIEFELLVESGETNPIKLLKLFFKETLPKDISAATDAVLWYFRCGNEAPKSKGQGGNVQAYSFSTDATAIFSDFLCYYSINLTNAVLHWWAFKTLLMGLPEDSNFKKRVYYRTCDLKKLPKSERERIKKIRKQMEIKTSRNVSSGLTLAERNAKMLEYAAKRSAEANESEVGING